MTKQLGDMNANNKFGPTIKIESNSSSSIITESAQSPEAK